MSSSGAGGKELSAGGVVVDGDQVLVIVPTRRAANGSRVLALPKGHPEAGESIEQAAMREVREETGVVAQPDGLLGEINYSYRRGGRQRPKRVVFFLFRYCSGDPADHDHEVEDARWMKLSEASTALTYGGERDMALRALARITADR